MELEIKGYEGKYTISDTGNVFSINSNRNLTNRITNCGYLRVELNYNGGRKGAKAFSLHRLVANAFIPNPENKSDVNHRDGNKQNNSVSNLEWCTRTENIIHSIENNLRPNPNGETNFNSRLTEADVLEIRRLCKTREITQVEIGLRFNMDQRNVSRINMRKIWKHI